MTVQIHPSDKPPVSLPQYVAYALSLENLREDYDTISENIVMWTYIFESLFGAPPVTLATLRAPSSCLSSFSWPCSSLLLFSRSSCALSLAAQK